MRKSFILRQLKKHRITVSVVVLLFIAKFLGFIKNIVLANYYGTGDVADAYQMAISIPTVTIGVLLFSYQAFTKGFYVSQRSNEENRYTSSFINFVFLVAVFIALFIIIFKDQLVSFFAPGFGPERINYVSSFLLPISIGVIAQVIANILSEYLRAKKSFISSQFSYLIINIVEILTIFLAFYVDVQWLASGYLIANLLYLLILMILCRRNGYKHYWIINNRHAKLFGKIFVPVLLSSLVVEINAMVDKIFASNFETGIVSTISYSVNIRTVLLIVAGGGLTVLFPLISRKSVEKRIDDFRMNIKKAAKYMTLLYIPVTIIVIFFAEKIVSFVYFRGEFNVNSLMATANCLRMYAIGMWGICIRDLLIKALYCFEKGREITAISCFSVVVNIILNCVLSAAIGYAGLPLATSISATLSIIPLYYCYKKSLNSTLLDIKGDGAALTNNKKNGI